MKNVFEAKLQHRTDVFKTFWYLHFLYNFRKINKMLETYFTTCSTEKMQKTSTNFPEFSQKHNRFTQFFLDECFSYYVQNLGDLLRKK